MLAQSILHWAGAHGAPNWDPGIPNGTFDPMTVTAVKSFQTNIGISPADADGVIGEPTRRPSSAERARPLNKEPSAARRGLQLV